MSDKLEFVGVNDENFIYDWWHYGSWKNNCVPTAKQDLPNSVFLDGDWCWDASPFQVNDETKAMVTNNICYLLNNFLKCSAYENIIFCWVMHEQSIINSILEKLDTQNCEVKCVSLVADEKTLCERLSMDVERGIRSEDIIERSIARIPMYQALGTIKIDTNAKTVAMIANEIKQL